MATPNENIATLINYWRDMAPGMGLSPFEFANRLYYARGAMSELMEQARGNPEVRKAFAQHAIFETALVSEPTGSTDRTLRIAATDADSLAADEMPYAARYRLILGSDQRSPRQIMLDGIWEAGTGGWFTAKDASGVTGWLNSEETAGAGMIQAISTDVHPAVRIAALRIMRDLAIPVSWATGMQASNVFASLAEQLPRAGWDLPTRVVMQALSEAAEGRLSSEVAKAAVAGLPMDAYLIEMGDGSSSPTIPGPERPWYKRGPIVAGGLLGLLGGVLAHSRR